MSLVGFKAQNHTQQTAKRGARDDVDDRGTQWEFIHALEERLGKSFTLDVAAALHDAKAPEFYTREQDGLSLPWSTDVTTDAVVWCNPPYSACGAWVRKAWHEWFVSGEWWLAERAPHVREFSRLSRNTRRMSAGSVIAMLLPANRVEQGWWQDLVEPLRDRPGSPLTVEFLRGRMRFDRPGVEIGPKGDRPPFGCALLLWRTPEVSP